MAEGWFAVASTNQQVFANSASNDLLIYTPSSTQRVHIGASNNTQPSKLTIDTSGVHVRTALHNTGHIIPTVNETYDLGSSNLRFRDLWLSGDTIHIGSSRLSRQPGGGIVVSGTTNEPARLIVNEIQVVPQGSTNSNIILIRTDGDTGELTFVKATVSGTASNPVITETTTTIGTAPGGGSTGGSNTGGAGTSNIDNLYGYNGNIGIGTSVPAYALDVFGMVRASLGYRVGSTTVIGSDGKLTAGSFPNITSVTAVSASSNIQTTMDVVATGAVRAGSVTSTGVVTAGGVSTTGSIVASGSLSASSVSTGAITASANLTAANLSTAGTVTATGDINTSGTFKVAGTTVIGSDNKLTSAVFPTITPVTALTASSNVHVTGVVRANGGIEVGTTSVIGSDNKLTAAAFPTVTPVAALTASSYIHATGTVRATGGFEVGTTAVIGSDNKLTSDAFPTLTQVTALAATSNLHTTASVNANSGFEVNNVKVIGSDNKLTAAAFPSTLNVTSLTASGTVSAAGLTLTGALNTNSGIISSSNISAANFSTTGTVSATGQVGAGSFSTTGAVSAGTVTTTGDVMIGGNLTVTGTQTVIDTQTLTIEDNIIVLNKNQTGTPLSTLTSGIEVERGDLTNYQFVFDESSTFFKVGHTNNLQAVATRKDTVNDTTIPFWNNATKQFDFNPTVVINSSGSLGVGTDTPGYKLDVTGDINFTGNLMKNGVAFTSSSSSLSNLTINSLAVALNSNAVYTPNGLAWSESNQRLDVVGDINITGNLFKDGVAITQSNLTANRIAVATANNTFFTPSGLVWSDSNTRLDITGDINFSGNLLKNGTAFTAGTTITDLTANKITVATSGGSNVYSPMELHWDNTSKFFGIGLSTPTAPLHVAGSNSENVSILANFDISAFSDARLKTDLEIIPDALEKVSKVSGYTYKRVSDVSGKRMAGVIAQEMLEVLPEVVSKADDGFYHVAYGNITALLINAVKELKERVEVLENKH